MSTARRSTRRRWRVTRARTPAAVRGFLLIVLLLFILLSTLMGRPGLLLRLGSRIVLIPVVAGIAYELMKWMAKHYETSRLVRVMLAPGLALQRLTTREPDQAMLEVSIKALREVLDSEGLLANDPHPIPSPSPIPPTSGEKVAGEDEG
jgi:uncharacterized protein YqhQ